MSQFATIKTLIKDEALLIKCLEDMGYPVEKGNNLSLYGYLGDRRSQTADIVIRRKHIGSASNDIGFKKVGEYYEIIISQYDKGGSAGSKITGIEAEVLKMEERVREIENAVKRKYAEEKVTKTMENMKKQGFALRQKRTEGKKIIFEYVRTT